MQTNSFTMLSGKLWTVYFCNLAAIYDRQLCRRLAYLHDLAANYSNWHRNGDLCCPSHTRWILLPVDHQVVQSRGENRIPVGSSGRCSLPAHVFQALSDCKVTKNIITHSDLQTFQSCLPYYWGSSIIELETEGLRPFTLCLKIKENLSFSAREAIYLTWKALNFWVMVTWPVTRLVIVEKSKMRLFLWFSKTCSPSYP